MSKRKCVIVDDQVSDIDYLVDLIEKFDNFSVYKTFTDPVLALQELYSEKFIDVLFVDVEMPEMDGITLVKSLLSKVGRVVFTTGHTKYAVDAFEVHANGYLHKPFNLKKFADVLLHLFLPEPKTEESSDFFFVQNKLSYSKVFFRDILYIEANENNIVIQTVKGLISAQMRLKQVIEALPKGQFLRIHRSYIVSVEHIDIVEKIGVTLNNGATLKVGNSYRQNVTRFLAENTVT